MMWWQKKEMLLNKEIVLRCPKSCLWNWELREIGIGSHKSNCGHFTQNILRSIEHFLSSLIQKYQKLIFFALVISLEKSFGQSETFVLMQNCFKSGSLENECIQKV